MRIPSLYVMIPELHDLIMLLIKTLPLISRLEHDCPKMVDLRGSKEDLQIPSQTKEILSLG